MIPVKHKRDGEYDFKYTSVLYIHIYIYINIKYYFKYTEISIVIF